MNTTWHTNDEKLKNRVKDVLAARQAITKNDFSSLSKEQLEVAIRLIKNNPLKK